MNDQKNKKPSPGEADLFGWATIFYWAGYVLRAPLRHKALAIVSFLFVFSMAGAAIFVVPLRYQVQSTLLAGYPQVRALSTLDRGEQATHAARDILLRRENLRGILEKTDFPTKYLERRPWAIRKKDQVFEWIRGEPRTMEDLVEGLLDTFEERLWVDVDNEATLVITFQWWDADLAVDVVQAAQDSFIEARWQAEVEAIAEAIGILETQQVELEDRIEVAMSAFEEKRGELRSSRPAAPRRQIRAPTRDPALEKLREDLASKEATLADLEGARRQRITQLQEELLQQESIYAANHPALTSTRRMIEALREPSERVVELKNTIARLRQDVAARGGRNTAPAQQRIDPAYAAVLDLSTDDERLDLQRGQLMNLLGQHGDLRDRIQSLRVEGEIAEAAFSHRYSVITPARLPRGPIRPLPLIFLVGGIFGGVAFMFLACASVDIYRGRLLERWEVEHDLQLPVLMEAPKDLRRR